MVIFRTEEAITILTLKNEGHTNRRRGKRTNGQAYYIIDYESCPKIKVCNAADSERKALVETDNTVVFESLYNFLPGKPHYNV